MSTPSLFGDVDIEIDAPATEGIKYAGSKLKLVSQILRLVSKSGAKSVLDGCARAYASIFDCWKTCSK
jgi:adenine-specific DNA-methyltransferase